VNRRHDDPSAEVTPADADAFFAGLPQVIAELEKGRRQNAAAIAALEKGRQANRRLAKAVGWGVLILSLVAVVVGMALDRAQDDIRDAAQRDRQVAYQTCQAINQNARGINSAVDTAQASLRTNDSFTAAEKRARIESWEQVRQAVPACEPLLMGDR
jgi:hypothetical protein